MNTAPRKPPRIADKATNRWHRPLGLIAAAALLHLIATGLPLQFTTQLGLGTQPVYLTSVHTWYGIDAPDTAQGNTTISQIGETLLFADTAYTFHGGAVEASATIDGALLLVGATPAGTRSFLLDQYELVEIDASVADGAIEVAGLGRAQLEPTQPLSSARLEAAQLEYRARAISWERLLQDLHSGRIFGAIGEWIVNLSSAVLLGVAATGLVLWQRRRKMLASFDKLPP